MYTLFKVPKQCVREKMEDGTLPCAQRRKRSREPSLTSAYRSNNLDFPVSPPLSLSVSHFEPFLSLSFILPSFFDDESFRRDALFSSPYPIALPPLSALRNPSQSLPTRDENRRKCHPESISANWRSTARGRKT